MPHLYFLSLVLSISITQIFLSLLADTLQEDQLIIATEQEKESKDREAEQKREREIEG